jgi:hypothetical protein
VKEVLWGGRTKLVLIEKVAAGAFIILSRTVHENDIRNESKKKKKTRRKKRRKWH